MRPRPTDPLPFRARAAAPGLPLLCAECNTPILRVAGGRVIIRAMHHSKLHTSTISLADLRALLDAAEREANEV